MVNQLRQRLTPRSNNSLTLLLILPYIYPLWPKWALALLLRLPTVSIYYCKKSLNLLPQSSSSLLHKLKCHQIYSLIGFRLGKYTGR